MVPLEIISCEQILNGRRLNNAQAEFSEILPAIGYDRIKPFFVDLAHINVVQLDYYREIYSQGPSEPKPLHLFRFERPLVVGQGTVILRDNLLLFDSAAEYINHGIAPEGMEKVGANYSVREGTNTKRIHGTSVLVKRPWYRNFGHWLVDLMPILPVLSKANVDIDNIIFGNVHTGNVLDIMIKVAKEFFPDANIIFVDDCEPIRPETLLYFQPIHVPPLFKHPEAMRIARETAKALYPNPKNSGAIGKRMYISRQKIGSRNIVNNFELETLLKLRGFETFFPEEADFSEQIWRFSSAEAVVGVKGAALTNLIFCAPKTDVLVLSPESFVDPFFWDIASQANLRYSEIFCKPSGSILSQSNMSFEVSLQAVERYLSLIPKLDD